MTTAKTTILFVCMGNICRSPAAECLMQYELDKRGIANAFELDSAGTGGWHVGCKPDKRMRAAANAIGKQITGSARKVCQNDFSTFDWIFCMDSDNYDQLIVAGANPEKTHLILEFVQHTESNEVPDPYYGGDDGFAHVVSLLENAVLKLIDHFGYTS